ncbi:MAG TPA: lytic murein transglycosylase [Xanthobacteraceae bacterium]|nr:lytic murein transglycosylase [Xanthobacteraceae bacterium]
MMRRLQLSFLTIAALVAVALTAGPAFAVSCRTDASFERWLADFKREAAASGISQRTLAMASPDMVYDQRIVNIDRGQRVFTQTFIEFSGRMVAGYRIQKGGQLIQQYGPVFARAKEQFGVPAAVITAFWGLESDFGGNSGKEKTLPAITSLAYDCRRAEMFRGNLLSALQLIERGDLRPEEMIGSWAGEIGQTQMMATEYNKFAVDYDGDGHRNLIRSVPDVIGSTANYLQNLGWQREQPWLTEVRVPATMPWDQADLTIQHPRSQWAAWGVTLPDGRPLSADGMRASLVLPMGRLGPAFLAYDNFQVYLKWNQSLVYSLTAAYYATRLAGAAPMHKGNGVPAALTFEQVKELQQLLKRYGYTGDVDGKLGISTRTAVKAAQMRLGFPADSWPTPELLARLHGA